MFSGPFEMTRRSASRSARWRRCCRRGCWRRFARTWAAPTASPRTQSYRRRSPSPDYSIAIQFGCDPQRTDDLVKRVFEEIEQFKTDGPTEKQVTDEREALLREFETNSKLNNYLLGQISLKYQYGEDPAGLWNIPEYYKKIDAATIQQAAKTYLKMEKKVSAPPLPEINNSLAGGGGGNGTLSVIPPSPFVGGGLAPVEWWRRVEQRGRGGGRRLHSGCARPYSRELLRIEPAGSGAG